jgi:ProP effector
MPLTMIETPPDAGPVDAPVPEVPAETVVPQASTGSAPVPDPSADAASHPVPVSEPTPVMPEANETHASNAGDATPDADADAGADADADVGAAAAAVAGATAKPVVPELPPAAVAERLAALFPALFGAAPQPLKLRIQADIQQRSPGIFTKKSLSIFLHRHTTSTAYLKALSAAPQRVDLDGQPAGEVAEEHRQAAAVELERRKGVHAARRQAERAAERDAQRDAQRAAHRAERDKHQAERMERAKQAAEREKQRVEQDAQRAAQAPASRAPAPEDAARREADAVLRAFASSTLTKANFCVLKGITEAQLDALIAQAPPPAPPPPRREARPDHRPEARGPRPERDAGRGPHPSRRPAAGKPGR